MNELFVRTFSAEEIVWDAREMRCRLGFPFDEGDPQHTACAEQLRQVITYRAAWREADVRVENETVDLGFCTIESHSLARNLNGCGRCVVIGVTLGSQVDRLISRLAVSRPADAFVTDALASAAAEALCDAAHEAALYGRAFRPRFSPGYGDCPLGTQRDVLSYLNAAVSLGITLTENCFMNPAKSITALIGLEK